MFKIINNLQEYKEFIASVQDYFGCVEEWENFFDFQLKYDDDGYPMETIDEYQGEIGYCPESFPCVVYHMFDKQRDRFGDVTTRLVDWVTFEEICLEVR